MTSKTVLLNNKFSWTVLLVLFFSNRYFLPNKKSYPEQIQKLCHLVEELETLRDAKQIIENYKAEYQQYLGDVPAFIMENDEAGFYSRLGFARSHYPRG